MKLCSFFMSISFVLCFLSCAEESSTASEAQSAKRSEPMEKEATSDEKQTVLFFGTSLTAGKGLSEEEAYPALIQEKIDALNMPYKVVNAGLSGETTTDGLNRIDWVLKQKVDVFCLELGANDALRGQPVDVAKKNMQGILDAVRAKNPDCTLMVIGMMAPPNLGTDYTKAFQAVFPALAKEYDAAFVPFLLDGVAGDASLNQADGIHPTAKGQAILAENVWAVLKGVL